MVVLGIDTATPATVAGVLTGDDRVFERRDDPAPGGRPQHAALVLRLAERALADAGLTLREVDRLAVGVGPGGFTGLRIGIATARGLAQARGLQTVAVGSLHALAAGARDQHGGPVAAVLDARRGEAFLAAFDDAGEPLLAPAALAPDRLAQAVARLGPGVLAAGDGAVRFREQLERAGAVVPVDGSAVHRIGAAALCRLGRAAAPAARDALVPDYVRDPDAKPPAR